MVGHEAKRFVEEILNRVNDTGEPSQIGRIKAKKIWIFGSFDNERVRQRDHGIIFVSDRRRLQSFGPISWFSFRVSECDDPKFIGHVDVVNDKWKTAHDVTSLPRFPVGQRSGAATLVSNACRAAVSN